MKNSKDFDAINVIPLVDVMLVLLTIVLMTSTFIATGGLAVELPRASKSLQEQLSTTVIEVDKGGNLYMNSRPQTLLTLRDFLVGQNRETPILIRADRDIRLQVFVDVLDLVKGLKYKKVSIQTESRA
ncbi:MAG: biopolymer transporter ExbD [Syntrophales bacterium]|jgi:biopolymer transport protein ExbD|nr:biopolymer transporter ExbD [Syntrophales bacterium]